MKRMRKLEMLLLILIVVCCAIYLTEYLIQENETEEEDETITVIDQEYSGTSEFSFTYGEGEKLCFKKSGTNWSYGEDESFPLDDDYLNTMFYSVCSLTASRVLDEPEELAAYGLDEPMCTVTINGEDGITLQLGDETSLGGERYASIGDGKVYLVDESLLDEFDYQLYDLVEKEDIPYIYTVSVCTVKYGDESFQLDSEEDADLIDSVCDLYWGDCVTYQADEAQLSAYGLDVPMTVTIDYVETESVDTGETDEDGSAVYETIETEYMFTVEIGYTEDGISYGRLPESNMVYQIDASIAEALMEKIS